MAAFIAKKHQVERVICFSSPLDHSGQNPAPWLKWPSQTPMERWYAAYHVQEPFAPWLEISYPILGIPPGHIFAFKSAIPHLRNKKQYHGNGMNSAVHANDWAIMLGVSIGGLASSIDSSDDRDDDDDPEE